MFTKKTHEGRNLIVENMHKLPGCKNFSGRSQKKNYEINYISKYVIKPKF